jgi:hypothetical protein
MGLTARELEASAASIQRGIMATNVNGNIGKVGLPQRYIGRTKEFTTVFRAYEMRYKCSQEIIGHWKRPSSTFMVEAGEKHVVLKHCHRD